MKKLAAPAVLALAFAAAVTTAAPAGAAYRVCKLVIGTGSHASNSVAHSQAVRALNRNRARHVRWGYVTASGVARRGGRNSRNVWNITLQQRMCRTR